MSRLNRRASNGLQAIAAASLLAAATTSAAGAAQALPETVPLPAQRPDGKAHAPEQRPKAASPKAAHRRPGNPNADDLPVCHDRLKSLGVRFTPQAPISEGGGCAVARPVLVDRLSPGIELDPPALLDCAAAEAASRFARDIAIPAAEEHFNAGLVAIRQASAYVCRQRNGEAKLSEHAYGNALDISGFVLANGRDIPVAASSSHSVRDFLRDVRGAACGPFKTVLGPGSNADHADHFHFDLARRRNGATYCR